MSFLQTSALLPSLGHASKANGTCHQQLRSKGSIASLARLVRNPIEAVGETVEGWYDGLTKEERAQKQAIEQKRQILYLKLRDVSSRDTIVDQELTQFVFRQSIMMTGEEPRQSWITSRVTMNGRWCSSPRNTMQSSCKPD